MKHTSYIHEVPDSTTAILFIHGILGTPNHFNRLLKSVPEEWSVYNILLDGHGRTVDDFAAASMYKWKLQVHHLVLKLSNRYDNILIVAHSMGTLFAIEEAAGNPKIKKLFLLDVPLMPTLRPVMILSALKIIFDKIRPDDYLAIATRDAYSITPDRRLWKYLKWIPNYLALFSEIKSTRRKICNINVPCFVFLSKHDELVKISSVKYFRGNPMIRCRLLPYSGHFYYESFDMNYILRIFQKFCSI